MAVKKALLCISVISFGTSTLADKKAVGEAFKSDKDQISYSIGHQIGNGLKTQNIEVNYDLLLAGIKDVNEGKPAKMTDQQMHAAMSKLQAEMQKKLADKAQENKAKGEEFLTKNAKEKGVLKTASGLQYKIIAEGKGKKPKAESKVSVNYKGTFIDGKEFDKSAEGQPATFNVNGVIKGWTEALQLMSEGSKWQIFVPSELAYGSRGNNAIPGNTVLVFDVELLKILE